jgi:hypothetical protein
MSEKTHHSGQVWNLRNLNCPVWKRAKKWPICIGYVISEKNTYKLAFWGQSFKTPDIQAITPQRPND